MAEQNQSININAKKIKQNREFASYSKDYGVGKINQIIRTYIENFERGKTSSVDVGELIIEIASVALNEINKPDSKIKTDVVYAAVEAISHFSKSRVAASTINELFETLKENVSGKPLEEQEYATKIENSEKMMSIRTQSLIIEKRFEDAIDMIPKLLSFENKQSHGSTVLLRLKPVIDGYIKDAMSAGEYENYTQKREQLNKIISQSMNFYEKKFFRTLDFNTGVELLRFKLNTGADLAEIKKIAETVYLSAKKFNISERDRAVSNDPTSKNIHAEYAFVLTLCGRQKELAEFMSKFNLMQEESSVAEITEIEAYFYDIRKDEAQREEAKPIRDCLRETYSQINNHQPVEESKTQAQTTTDAVFAGSYNYSGTLGNIEEATYLGGNFQFRGQVPDHCITKQDIMVFDTIVQGISIFKMFPMIDPNGDKNDPKNRQIPKNIPEHYHTRSLASLNFEKDMPIFMAAVDGMIRGRFTTTNFSGSGLNMEIQALLEESVYNDAFKSIMAESGAFGMLANGNSLTNISTLFLEGVGDCRHHAQIKQIMFDRWKDAKMNQAISSRQEASISPERAAELDEQIDLMSRSEVRIFDVQIQTDLKMKKSIWTNWKTGKIESAAALYRPETNEDGKFETRGDDKMSTLEEHTMCMFAVRDQNGELETLRFADAFYQNPDGSGDYDLSYNNPNAVNLAEKNSDGYVYISTTQANGKVIYNFNFDQLFNGAQVQDGRVPKVRFIPTAYAGTRDYDLFGRFEEAQLCGVRYDKKISSRVVEESIAKTSENHAERMQQGALYSNIRRIIVRNLIAKHVTQTKDDGSFDLQSLTFNMTPKERNVLQSFCEGNSSVFEASETEARLLNSVCNNLSEMRTPDYEQIYYQIIDKLTLEQKENNFLEINLMGEDSLESICNDVINEYLRSHGLEDAAKNRENNVSKISRIVASDAGNLTTDKETTVEFIIRELLPEDAIKVLRENGLEQEAEALEAELQIPEQSQEKTETSEQSQEEVEAQKLADSAQELAEIDQFSADPLGYIQKLVAECQEVENMGKANAETYKSALNDLRGKISRMKVCKLLKMHKNLEMIHKGAFYGI